MLEAPASTASAKPWHTVIDWGFAALSRQPPDSLGVSSHYGLSRDTIGSSSAGWSKSRQQSCGTPSNALAKRSLVRDWPLRVSLIDIGWGGLLNAIGALAAAWLDRWLK